MVPHTVLTMDIVSLRARAVTAEDWETVELCDAALGRPSAFYVLCSCSQEVAREECRQIIDSRPHMRIVEDAIERLKKQWEMK